MNSYSLIDKRLQDCLNSFCKIDQSLESTKENSNINSSKKETTKIGLNIFQKPSHCNETNKIGNNIEEETIHTRLYNEKKIFKEKKENLILKSQKEFNKNKFHPKISKFSQNINMKNQNVFQRLYEEKNNDNFNKNIYNQKCNNIYKNFIKNSNKLNNNNNKYFYNNNNNNINSFDEEYCYRKCKCYSKYKENYPFEPQLNKSTLLINNKLEKEGNNSLKRILKKKEKNYSNKGKFFSDNEYSSYFNNTSLIEKDKNKNCTKFIKLYDKCMKEKKYYENKYKEIRKNKLKLENFSFTPQINDQNSIDYFNKKNDNDNENKLTKLINISGTNIISPKKFLTNKEKINEFLENSRNFQSKKEKNLEKLTKQILSKESFDFTPVINKKIMPDDIKNIKSQISYINDYVNNRRDFLNKKKDEEEYLDYITKRSICVSKRKFVTKNNSCSPQKVKVLKNKKYFRNLSAKDVLNKRKIYNIEEFYNNSFYEDNNEIKSNKNLNYENDIFYSNGKTEKDEKTNNIKVINLNDFENAFKNITQLNGGKLN